MVDTEFGPLVRAAQAFRKSRPLVFFAPDLDPGPSRILRLLPQCASCRRVESRSDTIANEETDFCPFSSLE